MFERWFRRLRDRTAQRRINIRLERVAATGNLGDYLAIGGGIWELRLTYGPGYRLYYIHEGDTMIVLLAGGDKGSQRKDIAQAKALATEWRREHAQDS